jgi:hypothetical protein
VPTRDVTLLRLIEYVRPAMDVLISANSLRERGGLNNTVAWGELAGRARDENWIELQMRHDLRNHVMTARLTVYEPMIKGGAVLEIGADEVPYTTDPADGIGAMGTAIQAWIDAWVEQHG